MKFFRGPCLREKPPELNAQTQAVLAQVLWPHLSLKKKAALIQTSSIFRAAWLSDVKREKLMHCVLWNNPKKTRALLEEAKNHPTHGLERLTDLLCNPVVSAVTDLSGKPFDKLTSFQAALCTWNEILCELFKDYFEQIPNGLGEMKTQIEKIFPEKIEAYSKKQEKEALKFKEEILRPLITTISAANRADVKTMLTQKHAHSELGQAITAFRIKIKTLSYEDHRHNPFYLQKAYDLYEECFDSFERTDQRNLFYIQGIGSIQGCFPACYLQAFAQGLYYLVEEEKPFQNSFKFTHRWNNVTHLKIKKEDVCALGFDYACGGHRPVGARPVPLWAVWRMPAIPDFFPQRLFKIFVEKKRQALQTLCRECNSHQPIL